MRNFVFGDTGGHGKQLLSSLFEIGLDEDSLKLPEDVRIVHLGDLIHKGPDSNKLVHFVNEIMTINPGGWVQLLGNHELQHIPGTPKFWRCNCDLHTVTTLNSWLDSGGAKIAWALDDFTSIEFVDGESRNSTPNGVLFSHSGMTQPFWKEMGASHSALETAKSTNSAPISVSSRPGVMLQDLSLPKDRIQRPGPAWALAHDEVFPTWTETSMPFVQVHGHSTAFVWPSQAWYSNVSKLFRDTTELHPGKRVSVTKLAESFLIGLDPGFEKSADLHSQPYLTIIS